MEQQQYPCNSTRRRNISPYARPRGTGRRRRVSPSTCYQLGTERSAGWFPPCSSAGDAQEAIFNKYPVPQRGNQQEFQKYAPWDIQQEELFTRR